MMRGEFWFLILVCGLFFFFCYIHFMIESFVLSIYSAFRLLCSKSIMWVIKKSLLVTQKQQHCKMNWKKIFSIADFSSPELKVVFWLVYKTKNCIKCSVKYKFQFLSLLLQNCHSGSNNLKQHLPLIKA